MVVEISHHPNGHATGERLKPAPPPSFPSHPNPCRHKGGTGDARMPRRERRRPKRRCGSPSRRSCLYGQTPAETPRRKPFKKATQNTSPGELKFLFYAILLTDTIFGKRDDNARCNRNKSTGSSAETAAIFEGRHRRLSAEPAALRFPLLASRYRLSEW